MRVACFLVRLLVGSAEGSVQDSWDEARPRFQAGNAPGLLAVPLAPPGSPTTLHLQTHCCTPPVAGSWRGLLQELEELEAATPERVRTVAESTFSRSKVFVGHAIRKL